MISCVLISAHVIYGESKGQHGTVVSASGL